MGVQIYQFWALSALVIQVTRWRIPAGRLPCGRSVTGTGVI
jgi:hypothetical protein